MLLSPAPIRFAVYGCIATSIGAFILLTRVNQKELNKPQQFRGL